MKSKRGGRTYRIQEVEIVRKHPVATSDSPLDLAVSGIRQLRRHVAFNWNQTEHRVGVLLGNLREGFENGIGKRLSCFKAPPTEHVFAAISRKWSPPASAGTLSAHQAEIKRRVSHIPIYLVAKQNGKLVYIKPENDQMQKPIGLLFTAASGARQLLSKVRQDVPEFARDLEIISLDLGSLYEMFSNRKLNHLKNVIFRFVPEIEQINYAMEVMKQNGRKAKTFSGVPVFHVDGLVTGEERLTPLFFNKEDLDHAIDSATSRKLERDRLALKDQMEFLKGEAYEARLLAKQAEGDDAQKWLSAAAKAETRSRRLGRQLKELPDNLFSLVQVEVRSLEDVLSEMERDRSGQYGNTMLVPPGLAEGQMLETPFTKTEDKKIINLQNRV